MTTESTQGALGSNDQLGLVSERAMTREELDAYLAGIGDDDLLCRMREAGADLEHAAESEPDSEWHAACFAGALVYAQEASRRGLPRKKA